MATLEDLYSPENRLEVNMPGGPNMASEFLPDSTNLYRDESGTIRNLRQSEDAPQPYARPGFVMSPLAARYAESQRPGGAKLDDSFGIAANAYRQESNAAEVKAYQTADYLSQFLPPDRVVAETRRMTGVDLSGRLAATPNMMKREESAADLAEKRAKTAETNVEAAAKRKAAEDAPVKDYQSVDSTMNGLNRMEALASELLTMPGLNRTFGPIAGRIGSVTGEATNIETKLTTLKSRVARQALQEIRDASKTGGALGNVSDKDIALLENAIASVDLKQTPDQFRASMDEIKAYASEVRRQVGSAYAGVHGAPAKVLPKAALAQITALGEGVPARLQNGQTWMIRNGVPTRVR
jgi:hypothetical protein